MKCAYKLVQQHSQIESISDSMIRIYEGVSVVALREVFGFGFGRFSKYCVEVVADVDGLLARYQELEGVDKPDSIYSSYYAARRYVKDIGVNLKGIEDDFNAEQYIRLIGGKKTAKRIEDRCKYLRDVHDTVGILWMVSMLWLHEQYGYGSIRLERYYRKCNELFSEFAKKYIALDDRFCYKFVGDLERECNDLGVEI